ncbi:MAG: imidazole glycerol phosphate synthase subunit HisH [Magnetovibrio sp.]|nr:imidazole glycerol phosphate synthase subunit HisH [Magnetovibrio sp.]
MTSSNIKIVIIDDSIGNIGSLMNAFGRLDRGVEVSKTSVIDEIENADAIVLSGVGAFQAATDSLRAKNLDQVLRKVVIDQRKPFLGICLGMQMLLEGSQEYGWHEGLSFLDGRVQELSHDHTHRLPHVGWNSIQITNSDSRLLRGLDEHDSFYFDHSFAYTDTANSVSAATCRYGSTFTAVIEQGNTMGVQFHPEISGSSGHILLNNFLDIASAAA